MGSIFSCRKAKKKRIPKVQAPSQRHSSIVIKASNHSSSNNVIGSTINNYHSYYRPPKSPTVQIKKILKCQNSIQENIMKLAIAMVLIRKAERAVFVNQLLRNLNGTPVALAAYIRKACYMDKLIKRSSLYAAASYARSIKYGQFDKNAAMRFQHHCSTLGVESTYFNVHFLFHPLKEMKHIDFVRASFALNMDNEVLCILRVLGVSGTNICGINKEEVMSVCESSKYEKKFGKKVMKLLDSLRIAICFQSNDSNYQEKEDKDEYHEYGAGNDENNENNQVFEDEDDDDYDDYDDYEMS